MTALANKHGAINLAQGFPDFPPDQNLLLALSQAASGGKNQYAPMQGIPSLREVIAAKVERMHGAYYSPENEILITAGGTQAISVAISAFVNHGDKVVILEPAYDCYSPAVKLNGGQVIPIPLNEADYSIPWAQLEDELKDVKMLIINTPHNPTGTILQAGDMERLEKLLNETNTILLSDEVYEHIIFDGEEHQSACRFPGLRERTIIVCSFGKTYHATGWKMGYAIGPKALMAEVMKVYQFVQFSAFTPAQWAIAAMLEKPETYLTLPQFFQQKRDLFASLMQGSRFEFLPSAGSYFQCARYQNINEMNDREFANWLTIEHGVAAIPTSPFYTDDRSRGVIRFCFAKSETTLSSAAEKLCIV